MPDLSSSLGGLTTWLSLHAIALVVLAIALLLVYRGAGPIIHRVLVGAFHAQQVATGEEPAHRAELDRRVSTIEDLFAKLLRGLVIFGFIAIILGLFDLWSVVAGLGIVLAALTLAGQSIILDYLMGILILVESQYFKGDTVRIGTVEGVVEEVTLRRTVIRDVRGTLHSISNGLIRSAANLTRTFAAATVEIDGVADRDVESVIEVIGEVGRDLVADPVIGPLLLDAPGYTGTTMLSAAGATVRMSGKVRPEARTQVEQEMRRRTAAALAARGIQLIRPGAYPPR